MELSIIKEFFKELDKVERKEQIEELFEKLNIEHKYKKDKQKYPDLEFNIKTDEIKELKDKGFITNYNYLDVNIPTKQLTTLEKLLYALIWKNGDLVKIKHIISGICGEESSGKVFNQFGKHLCNKDELIIDQHVLRAYIYYKEDNIVENIDDEILDRYSNDYKEWINNNEIFKENKNLMDDILFAIGKSIKSTRKQ